MLTRSLGTWQIAGNACTAALAVDPPRSINISLQWAREPGPTETEHLNIALPEIVESALESLCQFAMLCEALGEMIADGDICRIRIKDGAFVYARTASDQSADDPPASDQ